MSFGLNLVDMAGVLEDVHRKGDLTEPILLCLCVSLVIGGGEPSSAFVATSPVDYIPF